MERKGLRVLLPSIVDPAVHRGGAGAVTRTFVKLLERAPLNAQVVVAPPPGGFMTGHRFRQLSGVARSLVSSLPSKAAFTYSRGFRQNLKRLLQGQEFDVVIINGADLLWLLSELPPTIPRILLAHNIEHQLFLSQIDAMATSRGPIRRMMLRDWRRLQKYEMCGMREIENVIFLSSYDARFGSRHCPNLNSLIVPPLFDYEPVRRSPAKSRAEHVEVGFMANFGWWPNRRGLRWFLAEVFPHTGEHIRFHLFGEQSHKAALQHRRIVQHGFVPEIRDVWQICDFMICPVFSGSGVKIKLAEAVYNGVPVLASSFAARGLPLEPDPGVLLLDTAEEWVEFLSSAAVWRFGCRRVAPRVADSFTLDSHLAPVQTFIDEVMEKHRYHPPIR